MADLPIRYLRVFFSIAVLACAALPAGPVLAQGTMQQVKVFGPSLKGNLEGENPERDVFVYLPPSYSKATDKHYPVIYILHGYGVGAHRYVNEFLHLPASVDQPHDLLVGRLLRTDGREWRPDRICDCDSGRSRS